MTNCQTTNFFSTVILKGKMSFRGYQSRNVRGYQSVNPRTYQRVNQRVNSSDPDDPEFGTCEFGFIGGISAGCDAGCGWYDAECRTACENAAAEQYPRRLFCRDPVADCQRQCNQDYWMYIGANCPEGCVDDPEQPECTSCVASAQNVLDECLMTCDEPPVLNVIGQRSYRGLVRGSRFGKPFQRTSGRWPRQTVYRR